MSRTEFRSVMDEWEVEVCDTCGHEKQHHHTGKEDSFTDVTGKMLRIVGCVVCCYGKNSVYHGTNPWPRCPCKEFK